MNELVRKLLAYTKQDYVRNIEALLQAIKDDPQPMNLDSWVCKTPECGTLYCAGGKAASMPFFNEQGLILDGYKEPSLASMQPDLEGSEEGWLCAGVGQTVRVPAKYSYLFAEYPDGPFSVSPMQFALNLVFGPNATMKLFLARDYGPLDAPIRRLRAEMGFDVSSMTDKDLAIARLERRLTELSTEGTMQ